MKDELPKIELPETPAPPEWVRVVEQLIERAEAVQEWAADTRQRAILSKTLMQNTILEISKILEAGDTDTARAAAREAAAIIHQQRAGTLQ